MNGYGLLIFICETWTVDATVACGGYRPIIVTTAPHHEGEGCQEEREAISSGRHFSLLNFTYHNCYFLSV